MLLPVPLPFSSAVEIALFTFLLYVFEHLNIHRSYDILLYIRFSIHLRHGFSYQRIQLLVRDAIISPDCGTDDSDSADSGKSLAGKI